MVMELSCTELAIPVKYQIVINPNNPLRKTVGLNPMFSNSILAFESSSNFFGAC